MPAWPEGCSNSREPEVSLLDNHGMTKPLVPQCQEARADSYGMVYE
jgi:hypothetical protein